MMAREPSCIHSDGHQPMSACSECKDHPRLAEWKAYWASRPLPPGARGTCPVCLRTDVLVTRGGLRRHAGSTEFDLATDGICSGSGAPALEELDDEERALWRSAEVPGV